MLDTRETTGAYNRQHGPARSLDRCAVSGGCRSGPRWFCAWTEQQRESRAAASIIAAGFDAYLPLHLDRDSSRHIRIGPLWPRYVFVRFDRDLDPWGGIFRLRGVSGLIQHGHANPTALPEHAMTELLARTSTRGVVDDPGYSAPFAPPAGHKPVWEHLTALDPAGRHRLLLRLFGASVTKATEEAT